MKQVEFYFDFLSPFAYLANHRLDDLPGDVEVVFRPVLFAGLLNHWGHKGPAEIPGKRRFTFRQTQWLARRMGVPYRSPRNIPFNPLRALRLCLALGATRGAVDGLFACVWQKGWLPDDDDDWHRMAAHMGAPDASLRIAAPEVKQALLDNGDRATAAGVFGVPTFVADGHLFWGVDAVDFLLDYLRDPALFDDPAMRQADAIGSSARR
ncbi:MAG: DsbA family protein [Hyphomicrobiales bacterium]|nr:DsbA family protein [Hyphomicrobiales bacterium]MCP5373380.1 DsbA family protein [Hyphomicrobiales bacterium]